MRKLLILAIALGGCAHKPEAKSDEKSGPEKLASAGSEGAGVTAKSREKTCAVDADCGDGQLCVSNRCVDITPDLAECQGARVHFGFEQSEISDDDRRMLERVARCLKADRQMQLTIEGNADERGTDEYNMALGDRRANSIRLYLERLGVSSAQLRAVSYGEERPECTEQNEDCWAKNRRAALKSATSK